MNVKILFAQYAVFEPGTRNTGTAIAGKNIANPIAMISASVDMLHYLGHKTYADAITNAIRKTISEDKILTQGIAFVHSRLCTLYRFKCSTSNSNNSYVTISVPMQMSAAPTLRAMSFKIFYIVSAKKTSTGKYPNTEPLPIRSESISYAYCRLSSAKRKSKRKLAH